MSAGYRHSLFPPMENTTMEFDEKKPEPIVTPDTPNKTKFHPEEAPWGDRLDGSENYYWYYTVLRNLNRGTHTRAGNNLREMHADREPLRFSDNLGIYDSIACQLDLPSSLKRWGKKLFKRSSYQENGTKNFKEFSSPYDGGMGIALTAFCACSYVCWQSGWQTHPNQPDRNPNFKRIQSELGFEDKKLRTWYGRFENKVRTPHRSVGPKNDPSELGGYI